jgi:bacillithiol biosynthesis deacetylase BshB1
MKIVVFGIHPDDVELGCGGTVASFVSRGHDVVLADLTRGEASSNGTPQQRSGEAAEAARILGCSGRVNLDLPDTRLNSENPDQQRAVVATIRRHRPDLVILPSNDDPHPDHASGGTMIERAMYLAGVHGYKTGGDDPRWPIRTGLIYPGRRDLEPDLVVDISGTFETKMKAIRAHRTQFATFKGAKETPLNRPEFLGAVEARAVAAGYLIGARYGEAFKLLNPIALEDPAALVTR